MSLPTTELFTGLRPTGDLTLGNYLGAIKPMIDLQSEAPHITMFVADLHGLTDQEPETIAKNRYTIAADYIALGLDVEKANIYMQSAISDQLLMLSLILSRHITMSELMRVPTLKDKLKDPEHPEKASVMLANYPILMAADILSQGSKTVPVGSDQIAHLEVARLLARRFNSRFGDVFYEPLPLEMKNALRIMSLTGDGKMSKSKPNGAILLSDTPETAAKRIRRAETAVEGEISETLESHFTVVDKLGDEADRQELARIKKAHLAGDKVMGEFKTLFANVVRSFLQDYQTKLSQTSEQEVRAIIDKGNQKARENAQAVLEKVIEVTGFNG